MSRFLWVSNQKPKATHYSIRYTSPPSAHISELMKVNPLTNESQKQKFHSRYLTVLPLPDMSTVRTGANRGVSRYLTENYLGLSIFKSLMVSS
jgi:hypothetical protein